MGYMYRNIVDRKFPNFRGASDDLFYLKVLGVLLTVPAVLAGYGLASLTDPGVSVAQSYPTIIITSLVIMIGFYVMRAFAIKRHQAMINKFYDFICHRLNREANVDVTPEDICKALKTDHVELDDTDILQIVSDEESMRVLIRRRVYVP